MVNRFFCAITFFVLMMSTNAGFSFSEEIRYQSGGRRDPFVHIKTAAIISPDATESHDTSIIIEGIVFHQTGSSVVVVGGEPYKVGESVSGKKVTAIHRSYVLMEDQNGKQNEYWVSESERPLSSQQEE